MNHVFTLAYNLPSEVEKVTGLLYDLNDKKDFVHHIIDLGFPIVTDDIPNSFDGAKEINSQKLMKIAEHYGSKYAKRDNIGVSQNWTQAYRLIQPEDDDVIIGQDPDEHPQDQGWVRAMGDILRQGEFAMASLLMTAHVPVLERIAKSERWIVGHRVLVLPNGALNWALIGLSGKFMNKLGEMPIPQHASRYGWIEGALTPYFDIDNYWCVMPDYKVRHTDFELGDPGTSSLLRAWKNQIVFNIHQYGQISFEEFLTMRKEDRI